MMPGAPCRTISMTLSSVPMVLNGLEQSIHDVIERCPNRNRWVLRSGYYER